MRYMTIRKFASESGYSEDAIRSKIRDGIWRFGEIWYRAPDDWKGSKLRAAKDIEYQKEKWADEQKRTTERNAWVRDLRASL
ncbi:Phage excisionase [Pseudomonas syringae pv. cilantro]|uniref:Phage excisionase n=2 Tax=Pseudomonas syringae group TaxID=136849 RepID=A0A0N0GFV8_PSESX|nr:MULTISPECIES: hypothetical protein [Pseudomonas syringae group]KPC32560.1 Phage excisionase [Pseudomonas syringae pv. cilantro]KPW73012.1 Phage excisionase [Pseudomonas syringae pv. coriandricola]RMN14377.1 Phage excisionase [Pseudomonas syringae pv. coriandricola]